MCPEPDEVQARKTPLLRRLWPALLVMVLLGGFAITVANNAFGRNIQGAVSCEFGRVSGVFIEADRVPRAPGGMEIQSGFASWRISGERSATFHYWLPYGGDYSIHFGCGMFTSPKTAWATDNRTPLLSETGQSWHCTQPFDPEEATAGITVTSYDCRPN